MPAPLPHRMRAAVAALLLLAAGGCLLKDDRSAKRGSEVENEIAGVFVDGDGRAGAGASVKAYDPNGFSLAKGARAARSMAVDSVVADAKGRYSLRGLPPGRYNLVGDLGGGSLVALIPAVDHADTTKPLDLGVDTLRAPGWIEGRVTAGGAGKGGVIAYLPGTSYLAISDENGAFLVSGVPEGRYRVSYLAAGFGAAPDTGIVVASGDTTRLGTKELGYDTALPPPEPTGLGADYDTLAQAVRLHWNPVRVSDLLGYLVYRDRGAGDAPELLTPQAVRDTFFADTLPDSLAGPAPREMTYRVRSIDRDKNTSVNYSAPLSVAVAPSALATTVLRLEIRGGKEGRASIGDTLRLILDYSNPGRDIRRVEWFAGDTAGPARTKADSGRNGKDTLTLSWPDPANRVLRVRARDASGTETLLDTAVEVLLDPPTAEAGRDTVLLAGDTVRLAGTGSDGFGRVVRWEWDVGATGAFVPSDSGKLAFKSPTTPVDRFPCILRVTDDDGLRGLDTMFVKAAAPSPPVAVVATPFAEVFTGDTVRLSSSGSRDSLGRIVKYEWDVGAKGTYAAAGAETSFVAGAPNASFACILRVTDNDGQSDTARVTLAVRPRDRYLRRSVPPGMDTLTTLLAWVMGGRLWVAGTGPTDNDPGFWFTDDLATWKRAVTDYPVGSWGTFGASPAFQVVGDRVLVLRQPSPDEHYNPSIPPRDIWASRDGSAWDSLSRPDILRAKLFNVSAAFAGELWLLNGYDMEFNKPFPGTLHSSDGILFTQVPGNPAYGNLSVSTACPWAGRLWIFGGSRDGNAVSEVWSSADGAAWIRSTATALSEEVGAQRMFERAGKIWLYGLNPANADPGEAWSSSDGVVWTKSSVPVPLNPYGGLGEILEFKGKTIEILEGEDATARHDVEVWIAP